ncbi:protein kinase domain-containing protein [Nocardia stercoris]|uniref:Protein kinase n=1 Tax=Nocardia stercoris TaxID=2483361 RepID=A0A3M2KYH1_9NOCA|nr:protein kinase [Nocardia stercoris]RMI30124.1 protein kinase [Nocardia stercoris]
MVKNDLHENRPDVSPLVAADLRAAGFDDAEQIGRGGFGAVYRCRQVGLDRTVAVKVLTGETDEESRARFVREQRAMGRLTGHPNIATVLEVGVTSSGRPYLVMPYYPLDSLAARVMLHGPLPVDEALRIGAGIARALESAHRLGILHRDVKPGNILLTEAGEPALADFGIAHIKGGFETATGIVTASPAFTAPEVLDGRSPTPAADVYGLGATLFCALTGHAAFERHSGEQVVAQFVRISTQPVPDLRENDIPGEVCEIVESAMHRDPGSRPTAAELRAAIEQVREHRASAVREPAPPSDATAGDAPPTRAAGRYGPPAELTSFVGRRGELAELRNLLAGSRLVTLTGMGGVGKTRLARQAAAAAQGNFPDGVWDIDLAEVRDPSLVAHVAAAAIGVPVDSARPVQGLLLEFLRSKEALLVVDNCEQVVASTAALAETLLAGCPRLQILATSREPLDIAGETVRRLMPLGAPAAGSEQPLRELAKYDAVTLFTDRAAAAVPGFTLTEDNRAAVVAICTRLDGLPLAIELAAARLRSMSPTQILQRLTDRFTLLTRGHRTAPTRQQTLRWCIDWSYQLCTAAEQRLWARLSVFAGGFELDAVEAVCGVDTEAAELDDALSGLVDKSIVIREELDGTVRFRMLETVREYGQEKLCEAGTDADLRRRHRDWCAQLVLDAEPDWISGRQQDLLTRFEHERGNVRAALEFCMSDPAEQSAQAAIHISADLLMFWSFRGLFGEGRRWLDRALAHPGAMSVTDRVRAVHADVFLAAMQRDLQSAEALLERGRALAEQEPTPMNQALIGYAEADLALYHDDPARAVSCAGRAVEVLSSDRRTRLYLGVLLLLGVAHTRQGELARGVECYQRILSITEPSGESLFRSCTLSAAGIVVWLQGDRSRGQELLREALRVNRRVRSQFSAAVGLEAMALTVSDTDSQRSAVLMGAAQHLMPTSAGIALFRPELDQFHRALEGAVRSTLGDTRFRTAWRRGQAMDMDTAVGYALEESTAGPPTAGETTLTERERQVADLVAQGLTNKQISARLVISQRTADAHVGHILTKLGFTSRAQIAAWIADEARKQV